MDKKLYRKTVDSIRLSDAALERTLRSLREADTVGKVTAMTDTKKRFSLKKASVIAAALAVAIILGAVFAPQILNRPDRSFTITANAAELTDSGFVTVCDFDYGGGGGGSDKLINDFQADFKVEGKNIESVRYDISGGNAVFGLDSTKDIFTGKYNPVDWFNENGSYITNLMDPDDDGDDEAYTDWLSSSEDGNRQTEFEAYRGYSVSYDNQTAEKLKESDYGAVGVFASVKAEDGKEIADALKTVVGFDFNFDYDGKNADKIRAENPEIEEYEKAVSYLCSKMFDNVTITVTVTYKDGSTGYQTIGLRTDFIFLDNVRLSAKIL